MSTNYVLTGADDLMKVLKQMESKHPDRVFITGVTAGGSVSGPTKRRDHYQHQLNHAFAEDCFSGNGVAALMSGGGFYIAHVPREQVNPDLLPQANDSTESA